MVVERAEPHRDAAVAGDRAGVFEAGLGQRFDTGAGAADRARIDEDERAFAIGIHALFGPLDPAARPVVDRHGPARAVIEAGAGSASDRPAVFSAGLSHGAARTERTRS